MPKAFDTAKLVAGARTNRGASDRPSLGLAELTIKNVPAGSESEHPRGILPHRNGSESCGPPRELETQAEWFPPSGSPGQALDALAGRAPAPVPASARAQ